MCVLTENRGRRPMWTQFEKSRLRFVSSGDISLRGAGITPHSFPDPVSSQFSKILFGAAGSDRLRGCGRPGTALPLSWTNVLCDLRSGAPSPLITALSSLQQTGIRDPPERPLEKGSHWLVYLGRPEVGGVWGTETPGLGWNCLEHWPPFVSSRVGSLFLKPQTFAK